MVSFTPGRLDGEQEDLTADIKTVVTNRRNYISVGNQTPTFKLVASHYTDHAILLIRKVVNFT
jgi:hypothetical protein